MSSGAFAKPEEIIEDLLKTSLQTATDGSVSTAIMDALKKVQVKAVA